MMEFKVVDGNRHTTTVKKMADSMLVGKYYCHACAIGCGRKVEMDNGKYGSVDGGGPEYETVAALGSHLLLDDLEAIAKANEMCNRLGIDAISTGGVIAFAMEAFEKGVLTLEDTGGIELNWGDPVIIIKVIKMIADRDGIGNLLAEGTRYCSQKLGKDSEKYAMHVKVLELPAHDPRALHSMGVAYATANRGGCHLQAASYIYELGYAIPEIGFSEPMDQFQVENKAKMTALMQHVSGMADSIKICKFLLYTGVTLSDLIEWLNLVTGWDMGLEEYLMCGERVYNLKRKFNIKNGIRRKDDTLPYRLLHETRPTGNAAGKLPSLETMLDEYYSFRDWDEEGIPTAKKLVELGLDQFM